MVQQIKECKIYLTSKVSHHCMPILIEENIVAKGNTYYFNLSIPSHQICCYCGTHLLRSLWMIGWVRLCRYSMPLATSMAMLSLDCRSISLSIDISLEQQPLSSRSMVLPITHSTLHRSIGLVYQNCTWSHS